MKIHFTAEIAIAHAVIWEALRSGFTVSVFDCEEFTLENSIDFHAISKAMRTSDDDTLVFRNADGEKIGWVWFVYGNSGWDVISDYSANPATEAIMAAVQPVIDRWEERLT